MGKDFLFKSNLASCDIVWIWMFDDFWTIFDTTCLCATASVAKLNAPLGLSVGSLTNVITFHLTFPHWWCSRDSYSRVISGHSMIQSPSVLLQSLARRLRNYFALWFIWDSKFSSNILAQFLKLIFTRKYPLHHPCLINKRKEKPTS